MPNMGQCVPSHPSPPPPRAFALNTAYLDPCDWAEFGREHPEAAEWLTFRSLLAEAAHLEELQPLTRRQARRLAELHKLLADVALTVC